MIFLSYGVGFFWAVIYRIIQGLRRWLDRGRFLCMAEDFVLAVIFAVSTYIFMYKTCGGLVRGYNYIALLMGIISAWSLCGRIRDFLVVRAAKKQLD